MLKNKLPQVRKRKALDILIPWLFKSHGAIITRFRNFPIAARVYIASHTSAIKSNLVGAGINVASLKLLSTELGVLDRDTHVKDSFSVVLTKILTRVSAAL